MQRPAGQKNALHMLGESTMPHHKISSHGVPARLQMRCGTRFVPQCPATRVKRAAQTPDLTGDSEGLTLWISSGVILW